jgi:hypothetical protein
VHAVRAHGDPRGIAYLRTSSRRVQPRLSQTSYLGFSFGGILTANLTNRYRALGLPKPRAIFLDDPHDGALTGFGEPALDASLAGIPSSTLVQCHAGAEGVFSEPSQGGLQGSCNAVVPKLGHIKKRNKDLVLTSRDEHGDPALPAIHGVWANASQEGFDYGRANAYDWGFCWKVWDALRSCAIRGTDCRYALGNTRQHRSMGRWTDGTPITPLKIQDTALIRALMSRPRHLARRHHEPPDAKGADPGPAGGHRRRRTTAASSCRFPWRLSHKSPPTSWAPPTI